MAKLSKQAAAEPKPPKAKQAAAEPEATKAPEVVEVVEAVPLTIEAEAWGRFRTGQESDFPPYTELNELELSQLALATEEVVVYWQNEDYIAPSAYTRAVLSVLQERA